MKKIGFLFALALASHNAHAVFDLGAVGGLSISGSTSSFTYGLTAGLDVGSSFQVGFKGTNMSGPSGTTSLLGVAVTTGSSQMNLLGQFKYTMAGFFIGADVGVGISTLTVNSIGVSTSSLILGPTVGYYMGTGFKYGIEVDYLISTAAGSSGIFLPMAGVKFAL